MSLSQQIKQQVVQRMPGLLKLPVNLVPFAMQRPVLEMALNRLLAEAVEEGDLDFLESRWAAIHVRDLEKRWFITNHAGHLQVASSALRHDVCFSGDLNDFVLLMGRQQDPDTLFFQRRLVIEGDTQLGLEIKNLLDNIDYDDMPKLVSQLLSVASEWVMNAQEPETSFTPEKAKA
ncbi:MAG: Ubiquinone biosynthesis accessory factor UbiJ [Candidatus Celerinatantimonas neptuna]|nr:MAG: Ubiquinone biosynthesis accessory factor UbiJ [Candidatus Celerinatantimonas neptuna]